MGHVRQDLARITTFTSRIEGYGIGRTCWLRQYNRQRTISLLYVLAVYISNFGRYRQDIQYQARH